MRVLFIFLDGIGLGENNPETNPFARAKMPNLNALLDGRSLLKESAPFVGERATLLAIDPAVGVDGLPQSATGQAMLLTGKNISAEIGYHYGPKPNPAVAAYLNGGTLFSRFMEAGKKTTLLNAYPPRYFDGIDSGRRNYSSIPMAVTNAGLELFRHEDLFAGRALSADFTGEGWRTMLGFPDSPVMNPRKAGRKLVSLAMEYDFSLFEYWASDYAGHKQQMETAVGLMETFDGVMGGLVEGMEEERRKRKEELLVIVTSDHGNMEDISTRRHTDADVPALVVGEKSAREEFTRGMKEITDVATAIWRTVMEGRIQLDAHEPYDPKSFWDEKARRAGADFESAVCLDDPIANKIIDRIQKRYIGMAFQQIRQRMDPAGRKILDYGCGTGRWVEFFRSYGMEYTGVDLSTEMVRIASERFPSANFSAVGIEGIRFPPQAFDVVCSIAVIHHNQYEEQSSIIRQLSRVIKPKGFLVLFESIGPLDPRSEVEFPRPGADWRESLKVLGLEQLWSRQTRYFSTRTIMNKLVGENRFPAISNGIGFYLDPYMGSFLPSRLQTRATMIFQKLTE